MNAATIDIPEAPPNSGLGRLITCSVDQLSPHPSLVRLHIVPSARDLSAAIGEPDHLIKEPLTITQDHYILAGHARWSMARKRGELTIPCLQLDMTAEEALLWLIQKHQRSSGINDFSRICLALELEPWFKSQAKANQQRGGELKGSSNLTKADKLDVRSKIASAAGVSVGNVSKVKRLLQEAVSELLDALREGEVSIHCASVWLKTPEKQVDQLRLHRNLRGITRTIHLLQRKHQAVDQEVGARFDVHRIGSALTALQDDRKSLVLVSTIPVMGDVLLLSKGLLKALESQGRLEL